jgi:hypothetical protein
VAQKKNEVLAPMMWFASAALAATAFISAPAYADMTIKSPDGSMELALPNGWHEGKPQGRLAKLVAVDGAGSRVVVRIVPKEDFKDATAVVNFTISRLKLTENEGAKTEEIKIDGKPAVRTSVTGTQSSGLRGGFLITVFEADGNYVEVTASADASGYAKQTQVLTNFAAQLKIIPTTAPATPTTPPPPTTPAKDTPVKPKP